MTHCWKSHVAAQIEIFMVSNRNVRALEHEIVVGCPLGVPISYYKRYAPDTIILKTRSEVKVKVTVTQKMVRDTLSSQDASTHQIWNSYFKEYRRYAPDTKRTDGLTDGRTVQLLYATQSSFGGIHIFQIIDFKIWTFYIGLN